MMLIERKTPYTKALLAEREEKSSQIIDFRLLVALSSSPSL